MAKATIIFIDNDADNVNVSIEFDPPVTDENSILAQMFAVQVLRKTMQEVEGISVATDEQ